MPVPQKNKFTTSEFLTFAETNSDPLELINGEIVALASPNTLHQRIVMQMSSYINNYVKSNKGSCEVFPAPFDVVLDNHNVVVPDISVICDKAKLDDRRCNGVPDWIIEIVSSNRHDDYVRKLALYSQNGVREYWIVDPQKQKTVVYYFEDRDNIINFYDFSQDIPVNIYNNNSVKLSINISGLLE